MTTEYLLINLAIATGIAADGAILTLAQARRFTRWGTVWRWSGALGLSHGVLPFVGFLGGWLLLRFPLLHVALFGVAGLLMAGLTVNAYRNTLSGGDAPGDEGARFPTWGLVWAVSVDALVTGPGKVPAVVGWSTFEIVLSFVLVGFGVFLYVLGASVAAYHLRAALARRTLDAGARRRITGVQAALHLLETLAYATFAGLGFERALAVFVPVPPWSLAWLAPALNLAIWLRLAPRLRAALGAPDPDPAGPGT